MTGDCFSLRGSSLFQGGILRFGGREAAFQRLLRSGQVRNFDPDRFERTLQERLETGARPEVLRHLLSEWTGVALSARQAESAWPQVQKLFAEMRERLGEPLSLQVALVHHFHSRRGSLRQPRLLPDGDLERLRLSAITDPLTGLYNRRFLAENLSRRLSRAARSQESLSVAIVDLQNFKSINDRFGHRTGDRALARTAEVIRRSLRPGDAPCRWGGDEFVLVLPRADSLAAVAIVERIRKRIAAGARAIRPNLSLDVYYGVASFPLDGRICDHLLSVADARLYRCREQWDFGGGNRRRYPRFELDRMRLRLLAGGGFTASVVNIGFGGLAFLAQGRTIPRRANAELSQRGYKRPHAIRIEVAHKESLPGGRLRVGCQYAIRARKRSDTR